MIATPSEPSTTMRRVPRLDPYLVWAQHTGFRYLVHGSSAPVRLAGELRENQSLEQAQKSLRALGAAFDGRAILGTRFFTATLSAATYDVCDALLRHASFVLAEPGMRALDLPGPRDVAASAVTRATLPGTQAMTRRKSDIFIGVIDGRCAFANQAFCADGLSKLDRYWDQGEAPAASPVEAAAQWSVPATFGYGRELDKQALDRIAREVNETSM
ncbi:MAG TPA: hypothetical protein VFO28_02175, partial [Burkholderiaceae bacterium]|nr:hypothetical protein [Burkholderiaceae bacterium]